MISANKLEKVLSYAEEVVDRTETFHDKIRARLLDIDFSIELRKGFVKAVKNLFTREVKREGKFLVVSGIDRVGKETHCFNPRRLKGVVSLSSYLRSKSYRIMKIKQPSYDTVLGGLVSAYLGRKDSYFKIDGKVSEGYAWILWSLDRAQHNNKLMDWISDPKRIVLAKRWTESNIIYQKARGVDVKRILRFERNIVKQDLTIILDAPPERIIKKVLEDKDSDLYENRATLEKVRRLYLNIPEIYPYGEIVVADSSRSLQEVNSDLLRVADEFLGEY